MKLFITGAGGFIGGALMARCGKDNLDYVAVDIADGSAANYRKADIGSKDIADLIPENTDAVIHLAALSRDPDCKNKGYECFNTNVMATLNMIDAAEKRKAKQFIFASTEWVYGSFAEDEVKDEETSIDITLLDSEYALSKLVSEQNLRQKYNHGFCPVTILRFGIIYGARKQNWSAVESIFNMVKTKEEVKTGSRKTGRCFIYVSDIVSGIIKAIGLDGFNVLNLQGDGLITLGDVIETSKSVLGKDVKVTETNPDSPNIRNVSNRKAKEVLKWRPEVDLKTGLMKLNEVLSE
ncbi:NAD(P)-dependent oxidoreductase [bacterium]|nr:NAD(P)-dependent oxidoreductase [bacterium]MBU4122433.1 NAD(P)-dependent oxidoreductase [bacterium]